MKTMFVIVLRYLVSLEDINIYLKEHGEFLVDNYQKGNFIASGMQVSKTGGIILAKSPDRATLKAILAKDPFYEHNLAEYQIFAFNPTRYNKEFGEIELG